MRVVLSQRNDGSKEHRGSAVALSGSTRTIVTTAILCGAMACITALAFGQRAFAQYQAHPVQPGSAPHFGYSPNGPPGGCNGTGAPTLQSTAQSVTVCWTDNSSNEQSFVLYKRMLSGAWQPIFEVPTKNALNHTDTYTYVDGDHSISGQCYEAAAVNAFGSARSLEACTVRPDSDAFPQAVSLEDKQWEGLNNTNDGTGPLYNRPRNAYLVNGNQTYGVNLNWTSNASKSLWKIEAQGAQGEPHLMYGQAVALRVWGGGWLKYGIQTWGVNLVLSDTPAYEWYVIGGTPGTPIQNTIDADGTYEFGLWDSAANGFLNSKHQTWGVNLSWDIASSAIYTTSVVLKGAAPGPSGWKPYSGSYGGGIDNTSILLHVANPNTLLTVLFIKPGHSSDDCGDPNAVVILKPTATLAASDMITLFGSATPSLHYPVSFVACLAQSGGGQSTIDSVTVNVQWKN